MIEHHKQLADKIAETLKLKINKNIDIFESDGKCANDIYVYDEKNRRRKGIWIMIS